MEEDGRSEAAGEDHKLEVCDQVLDGINLDDGYLGELETMEQHWGEKIILGEEVADAPMVYELAKDVTLLSVGV